MMNKKPFSLDDVDALEADLSNSLYVDILKNTGIDMHILHKIREDLTDEEWETMITLLKNEQYTEFVAYIEQRKPDIKQLYLLEENKKAPVYPIRFLVRDDIMNVLDVLKSKEIDLLFSYIQSPTHIPIPDINSLDTFDSYLHLRGFAAGAREKMRNLVQKNTQTNEFATQLVIQEDELNIVVNNVCIYKHFLNSSEQKVFAYQLLQSCVNSQDQLYNICNIPKELYKASVADLNDQIVFNVSKEKTYLPDMDHFVLLCHQLGVSQGEIDFFRSDPDIQQYIKTQEAYLSVRYHPENHQLVISLFDAREDETLAVVKQTSSLEEVSMLLQYFRQDNQDIFSLQKDKAFTLDASF